MGERLYGLDWLRIAAFGLLIFYHIGMFFVTWEWHIKSEPPVPWVEVLMLALNPWRLSLLFMVSGVASAFLLAKTSAGSFAGSRTARLLVPLVVGMALIVPPQPWVELVVQHGYTKDYAAFWAEDYFTFDDRLGGLDMPTWNHLWFVAYLWIYSLMLAVIAAALPTSAKAALVRGGEALLGGWRALLLPLPLFWVLRMTLYPIFPETHGLTDDWYNHAVYGIVFAIGLLLAHSPRLRQAFVEHRWPALAMAVAGYAGNVAFYLAYPDGAAEPSVAMLGVGRVARVCEAWGAMVALVGFALTWNPADSPARRYLAEATFPYYIAHQTVIVLAAFWLKPLGLGNGAMFVLLVAATVAGCALFYEIARRTGPLRLAFGLKPVSNARRSGRAPRPVGAEIERMS